MKKIFGFNKDSISRYMFKIGLGLIFFVFINILITSFLFIFKISISILNPIISFILTSIFTYLLFRRDGFYKAIILTFLTIFLIIAAIFIATVTIDASYDGIAYHKPAVGALKNGWNPVYESVNDFNISDKNPVKLVNNKYSMWVDHYAKASWFYGANIYKLTNNIESGKSLAWIITLVLFMLSFSYFILKFSNKKSLVLALLVAANPIGLTQLFSYYNDGISGNLLFILIILLTILLDRGVRVSKKLVYSLLFMTIVIVINVKFTSFAYAGIYCLTYLLAIIIIKKYRVHIKEVVVVGVLSLLLGIMIVGLSTYPKNIIQHKNPFYPLIGANNVDIITSNQPANFNGMNNLKKMFISNFSETDNISEAAGRNPKLKIPFTFNKNELNNLSLVDARIGGYGVWFSGALIVSFFVLLYGLLNDIKSKNLNRFILIYIPLIPTAILILFMSDVWWARYFPQLYLLPMIALIVLFINKSKTLSYVLIFIMMFNISLTWMMQLNEQKTTLSWRAGEYSRIDNVILKTDGVPKAYLSEFGGYGYSFIDRYNSLIILDQNPSNIGSENKVDISNGVVVTN